uniref:Uncharacterized protein n=1 Tax=Arundo donax TaxID=35708 RepID=A0A0A8ZN98_ARUDO
MFILNNTDSAGSSRSMMRLPTPPSNPASFIRTISMMIFTTTYAPSSRK